MITRFDSENLAKNLPDAYRKDAGSNNYKLLAIEKSAMDSVRENLRLIFDSLDIEKAQGSTLDLYGEMLGQARGAATDEQYRIMLKAKVCRNIANGDHRSIITAICATFGCEPGDVQLTELDAPCSVMITGLAFESLNANNIDLDTAVQIVYRLMPAGVNLESLDFSGTFEFSGGTELVYDEAAGFADAAQSIGGMLGHISTSDKAKLPV